MKFVFVLLILLPAFAFANIDSELRTYIAEFNLKALTPPPPVNHKLFALGRTLFTSRLLSGNKNIGCVDCHFPGAMTHDRLPSALGEGATGVEVGSNSRQQRTGKIIARNSPALFNLHGINTMFWDGRVSFDPATRIFTTPVAALNGLNPLREDITMQMSSALAAQSIFPIADMTEMRGQPGSNPIANAADELMAWDLIVMRLLKEPALEQQFEEVFPGEVITIGHVGEALAEFQSQAFAFSDTAYDRYLKGDLTALSELEKKGMSLFFNKASCGNCHHSEHLSTFDFDNIGVPQIGPGKIAGDDVGRAQWDKEAPLYSFRVPPLRNVALTAPFMHSGVFANLKEVIAHYKNPEKSLRTFKLKRQWNNYVEVIKDHDHSLDPLRLQTLAEDLEPELHLTDAEEEALLEFLTRSLTDRRLLTRLPRD